MSEPRSPDENEMLAAIVAGDDPLRGDPNFDPGSLRAFQVPLSSGRHTSFVPEVPVAPAVTAPPPSRSKVPKMDVADLLVYEPYSHKAFSPSALPPSNVPSPANVQDPFGQQMGLGLQGVSMPGSGLGLGDPALQGGGGMYQMYTPEQIAQYHAMQASLAAGLAGPQAIAALQQQLAMMMAGYGAAMPTNTRGFQPEQHVPMNTFYDQYPAQFNQGGRGGRGGRGRGKGGDPGHGAAQGGFPPPHVRRSPALQEFHNTNGTQHWELDKVFGLVAEFCKDQEASRFIQRKLDQGSSDDQVIRLFQEIVDADLEDIVGDVFGNYVVQKIIEVASPQVQYIICQSLHGRVVSMTLQTYGCRVIQRCMEVFPRELRELIFIELEGNVNRCVQDQNGNHVIQKCVEVDPVRSNFIIDSFRGMVKELATHAYGCRVIQCVLQFHPQSEASILTEMQPHAELLATDQFGNYVMQHVILHCHSAPAADIIAILTSHFYRFSLHKFASNVVEKLYKRAGQEMRELILHQLMQPCNDPIQLAEVNTMFASEQEARATPQISYLYCMIKDQFGNYVIQAICDVATDSQRERIIKHVHPFHQLLRRYTYGKHIVARLERMANNNHAPSGGDYRGGRGGRGGGRGGNRRGGPPHEGPPPAGSYMPSSGNGSSGYSRSEPGHPAGGSYGAVSFPQSSGPQFTASQQSLDYLSPSKEMPW